MVKDISRPTADAAIGGGVVSSPHSQQRSLTSPWASVVRGDSEQNSSPTAASGDETAAASGSSSLPAEQASASDSEAQTETTDVNIDSIDGQQKRPAWNKPLSDVVEPASVMGGAVSWPALSETTRPVPKSSTDNPRPVSDGSASSSQAPIITPPPQRPSNNNAHGNSNLNNPPAKYRRNRNGGGGGSGGGNSSGSGPSQATFNQLSLPMPPPFPVFEIPYGMVPAVMDTTIRGTRPVGGSQSHTGNDHSSHRNNNSRRGNYGSRPRGDGQYHNNNNNNHGGRRDQDRRDVHHHPPQYVPPPMGYMPSPLPPGAGPYMAPPPVGVFPGFDMASPFIYVPAMPPESFRAVPLVPSPPPIHFSPTNENSLTHMIVKQIDFYFSDDNLVKDNYLRSNMDDQGWVPIALIASFRRVQQLTKDIPVILESMRFSTVVEVQGDKLRKRDGWHKWLLSSGQRNSDSGTNVPSSLAPENVLAISIREVSLDDDMTNMDGNMDARKGQPDMTNMDARKGQPEMVTSSFSPDELTGESQLTNGEDAADATRCNRD